MISYFARVSLSFLALLPEPMVSRRRISISMCLSLMRTSRKSILPMTVSCTGGRMFMFL